MLFCMNSLSEIVITQVEFSLRKWNSHDASGILIAQVELS
jgi:hypothetical protein